MTQWNEVSVRGNAPSPVFQRKGRHLGPRPARVPSSSTSSASPVMQRKRRHNTQHQRRSKRPVPSPEDANTSRPRHGRPASPGKRGKRIRLVTDSSSSDEPISPENPSLVDSRTTIRVDGHQISEQTHDLATSRNKKYSGRKPRSNK